MTDWAPCPPEPLLAGRLVLGAALVGAAVVEVELALLHPATASAVAATAAKPATPSLLCLRTVIPPRVESDQVKTDT